MKNSNHAEGLYVELRALFESWNATLGESPDLIPGSARPKVFAAVAELAAADVVEKSRP